MVASVVLAGDALQRLHVDGVGRANGRLQFGAAGDALGHGSRLRMIGRVDPIVVKTPGIPSRLSRSTPGRGLASNGYHCNGHQSILGVTRIVTADADFDRAPGIIRLDPVDDNEW